jgi:hypothetical protein
VIQIELWKVISHNKTEWDYPETDKSRELHLMSDTERGGSEGRGEATEKKSLEKMMPRKPKGRLLDSGKAKLSSIVKGGLKRLHTDCAVRDQ